MGSVDLINILPIQGVKFVQGDMTQAKIQDEISKIFDHRRVDAICSDMAPDFTGEKLHDHMKSIDLNVQVLEFCQKMLKPGGNLLIKIF